MRGKHVITRALDRHRWEQIDDGAVLQRDGIIAAVGTFADLRSANPNAPVVGDGEPGATAGIRQRPSPYWPLAGPARHSPTTTLELWFATSIAMRDRIPVLRHPLRGIRNAGFWHDNRAASARLAARGILARPKQQAEAIIRAYEDIGMRVSYCYALREQNHLVYEANEQFVERVPADLRPMLARYFAGFQMPASDTIALFEQLHAKHNGKDRVKIQIGALEPAMVHR